MEQRIEIMSSIFSDWRSVIFSTTRTRKTDLWPTTPPRIRHAALRLWGWYPVAVSNGWLSRTDAAERVLTPLRFFEQSPQGPEPDVTICSANSSNIDDATD
jgi:hypothetical protein